MGPSELRHECLKIASANLLASRGTAFDQDVLEYAEKLFKYVCYGPLVKANPIEVVDPDASFKAN